mmetsp:Transcript_31854/g.55945  ORF Transcript_31854/g.55945 Transcript_31854/m.55945 type:complete len:424 (+) Transcript_31854:38-1309(+)
MASSGGVTRKGWGSKPTANKNVSLLSVMSEQLASNLENGETSSLAPQAKPHILHELKGMGFTAERITTAALATGNMQTELALEWILANPEPQSTVPATGTTEGTEATGQGDEGLTGQSEHPAESKYERELQDRAIALELAAQEEGNLSLEEARQLRRPFSKLSVSRDPALDRMMEEQRKMIHKNHQEMQMMESEFQDHRNTRSTPVKGSLTDQMNGMVTKHDSEENHAKNAQRLMDMCADDLHQHGDMSQVKMSNRTLNSFKRQVQKLKVRSDRKNMGARRTRANYTRQSLEIAGELVQEREGQDLRPGGVCLAISTEDMKWHQGVITGLATSLPRRYKVRFDDSGIEEFVPEGSVKAVDEDQEEDTKSTSPRNDGELNEEPGIEGSAGVEDSAAASDTNGFNNVNSDEQEEAADLVTYEALE